MHPHAVTEKQTNFFIGGFDFRYRNIEYKTFCQCNWIFTLFMREVTIKLNLPSRHLHIFDYIIEIKCIYLGLVYFIITN